MFPRGTPRARVRLCQCHHSSCLCLVTLGGQSLLLPFLGQERGFLGNKGLVGGEARRAHQPLNNQWLCNWRVRSCGMGCDVLLLGTIRSSPSHFCYFPPPPLFFKFIIQGLLAWLVVLIQRHQKEKRVIYFSRSLNFRMHVFFLTSANSLRVGGRKN